MANNILIIGPFGDKGGRELEAGFIGQILTPHYKVHLCSTGFISKNSQVYQFLDKSQVTAFRKELFQSSLRIQILSIISYLKNFGPGDQLLC